MLWSSRLVQQNTPTASLQRDKTPLTNASRLVLYNTPTASLQRGKCPRCDIKPSDGKAPSMLKIWRIRNTASLPSLPGPPCPGVVAPDRVLSMGQIEINCVLILD